jgi:hypothetical protein
MASGAGTAHVTSVLNVDLVFQKCFTNGVANGRVERCASRAIFSVGQNFDDRHQMLSMFLPARAC